MTIADSASLFRLDLSSGVPFYRQIIDQVLLGVADGRLSPGAQLPTVRQLAVDLSVNLNTVAKAYREMEIRGIVETQQGTGTFVATGAVTAGRASARRPSSGSSTGSCRWPGPTAFHSRSCATSSRSVRTGPTGGREW